MQLRFCSVDEWLSRAEQVFECDLPPCSLQDGRGVTISIKPFLALSRDVTIPGCDWIPILADGTALLDQMTHTPSLYADKARHIVRAGEGHASKAPPPTTVDVDAVLVGGCSNYYHWVIDYLPRLLFARKFVDLSGRKLLLSDDQFLPYQAESLRLLGVREEDAIFVGDDEAIRPRTTLIPSLLASTTVPHPALRGLLLDAYPRAQTSACERVYLSRQDAGSRRLTNEDALIRLLERYGFKRFVPGAMTFQEQIDLCRGARAVVGVHGAAMANIVFCPAKTDVFEIYTPLHQVTSMFLLSGICGHKHRFISSEMASYGNTSNPLLGTWTVNLREMERALWERFARDA